MTRPARCVPLVCFLLALFLLPPTRALAQRAAPAQRDALAQRDASPAIPADTLSVTIAGVDTSRFTEIALQVKVFRKGSMLTRLDASNFALSENGIPQTIESLDCPGDTGRRFSVAILLDRSNSMGIDGNSMPDSTKLLAAKHATRVFLDLLDARDEACVYSFASPINGIPYFIANQDFTSDFDALKRSLVPIFAGGGTWLWGAMLRTIDSLAPRQGKRILVVLTDGRSTGETLNSQEVIDAAKTSGIPVYIVGLGSDLDEYRLRAVASGTNGRFYKSPTASELEQAFRQLAGDAISDACVLRYTTRNACRDATVRRIELVAHTAALMAEDTAFYTAPSGLAQYTLSLADPGAVAGRSSFRVPVLLGETIRLLPLDYTVAVTWPATLLRLDSVATAGTISDGAATRVDVTGAGSATVSAHGITPARATGALFELAFTAAGTTTARAGVIVVDSADLAQECPAVVSRAMTAIAVVPCRRAYTVGSGAAAMLAAGEALRVPVDVGPPFEAGTAWEMTLIVRYNQDDLDYEGLDTAGGIAAAAGVVATQVKGRITLTLRGTAPGGGGTASRLLDLLFRARPLRASRVTTVEIDGSDLRTDCLTDVANASPRVLINGICEGIVVRRNAARVALPSPHPLSRARGAGTVCFTLATAGHARLVLHDAMGRPRAVLFDGDAAAGPRCVPVRISDYSPGYYILLLSSPDGVASRNILVLE